jgi:hypothetical protein
MSTSRVYRFNSKVQTTHIDELHASGNDVVFHARQTGIYLDGLSGMAPNQNNAVLHCNGILKGCEMARL